MTESVPSTMTHEPTEQERRDALRVLAHPVRLKEVFGSVLYKPGTAQEKARDICTLVARLMRCEHAAVNLLTADSEVTVAVETGRTLPLPHELNQSVCQYVVTTGEPFVVVDACENRLLTPLEALAAHNMRCYLGVPLVHGTQVIGALCVYGAASRQWTLDEVTMMQAWAEVLMSLEGEDLREAESASSADDGR